MSRKKNIKICYWTSLLALILISGIIFLISKSNNSDYEAATSYEQLELYVDFPGGEQKICIWENEESYLFFLPSGAENCGIRFGNIGGDATIRLADNIYTEKDSITQGLEYGTPMEMEMSPAGQSLGSVQVVFMKSANIPSVFIETASGSTGNIHADKEIKEEASMILLGADGSCQYRDDIEYIKTRGNSSFYNFDKKSYQIKLFQESPILDMDSAEKWILQANAIDSTLIKNELVFRFAQEYTAVPSVRGKYVDLYLNGEYAGNYYLCEKIEIDENRLNITDLEKIMKGINSSGDYQNASLYVSEDGKIKATTGLENPQDITGGYLLESLEDDEYENATNAFMTDGGKYFNIVSPSPATVEQAEYICNQFNEMEAAIAQENGINPATGRHFSEYMDVDSWTSKYLMEEVFHNPDSSEDRSMFFYKDSDSVDAHIYSGPMWDYDRALGTYGSNISKLDDPNQIGMYGIYVPEMMQHEEVQEQVYEKFRDNVIPYMRNLLRADVYHLREQIGASAEMNRIRWPEVYGYYSEYEASNDYLVNFLEQKVDYLEGRWVTDEEYCEVTFLDYTGNDFERYYVKKGDYLQHIPVATSYEAVFAGWYTVDDGIYLDARRPILQDVTYESRWIDLSLILENEVDTDSVDWENLDPDTIRYLADWVEEKQQEY